MDTITNEHPNRTDQWHFRFAESQKPFVGAIRSVFPGGGDGNGDLSAYSTTTQVLALVASSLSPYATSTQTNLSTASSVSTALLAYTTTAEADAAVAQALQAYVSSASLTSQLGNYTLTSAMNAALASRLAQLTGTGSVQITGTGASRNIHVPDLGTYVTSASLASQLGNYLSPLAGGVCFTVGIGLNANLTANTIALSLNYTEVRPSLYLTSGSGFKTLAACGDDLKWDGAPLAKSSDLSSKQDAFFKLL